MPSYSECANTFYNEIKKDKNGRYRSWEHCYQVFHNAHKTQQYDLDYLSLHLAFYLASWGMYRGSSFLLQQDYKIHKNAVEIILKPEYGILFGIDCDKLKLEKNIDLLFSLDKELRGYYKEIYKKIRKDNKSNISDTLITKILIGTMGCVPAYDRYFTESVREANVVTTGQFNKKSIQQLIKFYNEHSEEFEKTRYEMKISDLPYPQMKILDMIFWQKGYEIEKQEQKK